MSTQNVSLAGQAPIVTIRPASAEEQRDAARAALAERTV